ncbi:MAG: DUF3783 domain-containing protein [Blautia sp.]
MGTIRETVLYYTPKKNRHTNKLKAVLIQMGIRIRNVTPDQFGQKVGYLAGMEGYGDASIQEGDIDIPQEILVMKGFSERRMDELLLRLRKRGIPRISLKAVVTDTNADWSFYQLYREISEEHRQMHSASSSDPVHSEI